MGSTMSTVSEISSSSPSVILPILFNQLVGNTQICEKEKKKKRKKERSQRKSQHILSIFSQKRSDILKSQTLTNPLQCTHTR